MLVCARAWQKAATQSSLPCTLHAVIRHAQSPQPLKAQLKALRRSHGPLFCRLRRMGALRGSRAKNITAAGEAGLGLFD
jgi:hypothetical protein